MREKHIAESAVFSLDLIDHSTITLLVKIKYRATDLPVFHHHAPNQRAHKAQPRLMKTAKTLQLHNLTGRPHRQWRQAIRIVDLVSAVMHEFFAI